MAHTKTAALNGTLTMARSAAQTGDRKAPTLLELFWTFVIVSVLGLFAEVIVSYFLDGRWESRAGLIWGPFSPIYGLGAVLLTFLLYPLRDHPVRLFAASAFLGGAFEYVAGWFWETFFGIVAWSYIDQPFNLGGHTCLGIALVWGLAGMLWFRWGYPAIHAGVASVPTRPRRAITTVAAVLLAADIALTLVAFNCWFDRQAGQPIEGPVAQFCATYYGDSFMANRFETMSMWTSLAHNHIA